MSQVLQPVRWLVAIALASELALLSDSTPDDPELRVVLRQAIDALAELLREFNLNMHMKPRLIA